MGVTAAIIAGATSLIGTGISVLGASGGPSYPSLPKMYKLPVAKAKKHMEAYEKERMAASIGAWKEKFPLLAKGGEAEIEDIRAQQKGGLGRTIEGTLAESGLEAPSGANFGSGKGSQEALGLDLGLNPLALSQRTSQAVLRQIALNPEWTNKISGGTLASMLANANANQNAFTSFLGAQKAAMYQQGQAQGAMNTATLLRGVTGAAGNVATGMGYYNQADPFNVLTRQQARSDIAPVTGGGGGGGGGASSPYGNTNTMWNAASYPTAPSTVFNTGAFSNASDLFAPLPTQPFTGSNTDYFTNNLPNF